MGQSTATSIQENCLETFNIVAKNAAYFGL